MTRAVTVLTFLCLTVPVVALGQTSSITGTVRDSSGALLPGATVEVASPALIERVRTTVTDDQGQFRLVDLRPGVYSVTFSLSGFTTFRREGIELTANFTAAVNADLAIGAIEETVTVSGSTPIVDVQNVVQQRTISRELLDAVPTNRAMLGFAALTPAIISPPDAQDVGGSKGELSVRMAVHGSKQSDQKLLLDGMRYNSAVGDGTARGFYVNVASAQEVVIGLGAGGGLAESSVGGVQVNVIPKDGGNRFSGYFFTSLTGDKLQSNNLTPELEARGLRSPNQMIKIYDVNAAVGGPIRQDRLWFYSAHRRWGKRDRIAGLFHDSNLADLRFTADATRPADAIERDMSHNIRLTWQAARKHKFTFLYDWQHNAEFQRSLIGSTGEVAWEAATGLDRQPVSLSIATWTYPASNKVLFEAGGAVMQFIYITPWQEGVSRAANSILEQADGFRYNAPTTYSWNNPGQNNQRFSMSYVTGTHQFKTGIFLLKTGIVVESNRGGANGLAYTFSSGSPIQLTQYASPIRTDERLRPEFAYFAQDQWRVGRLTLNLGLRLEYLHAYVPASEQPAGLFISARSFDKVDCVPCWKDISPRIGASFDLFGNGKTALKTNVGRFTAARTVGMASTANPVNASVNNVNRSWNDVFYPVGDPRRGNFVPDCDLRNPEENAECGRMSNVNFGQTNITTRFDPGILNGWGLNAFNWQASAVVEHELAPGVGVSAGYFRTWYGNFTVTDNLSVTPRDYDHYCITAPVDPRLPGGGGNQICGLYDLNPTKFGDVNNLVTFASKFGKQIERYNGFDFNFSARLPRGAQVSGGLNIGNSVSNSSGLGATFSATNSCFIVDSPQQLYQCDIQPPYRRQVKIAGSYPLPWDLQASANFQTVPGPEIRALYNAPTALIVPTLGRSLSGGARTAPVQLIAPLSQFDGRINQLDVRLAKIFRAKTMRMQGMFDAYNVLNASPVLSSVTTYGASWLRPTEILAGRLIKFGVQLDF